MGHRTAYAPGTFCWVDVTTTDVAAASEFYKKIFGWTDDGHGGEGYTIFRHDGADVAGLMALSEAQREQGMPPSWSTYVSVPDADAAAARAAELGGKVLSGPFDIETTGRMAIVADPQGAVLVLWQPGDFFGAAVVNGVGLWSWNDVQTSDVEGAREFYTSLFGWAIDEIPGSGGQYYAITNDGHRIGGMMPLPPGMQQSFWNLYFGTESVGGTLERIEAAGGKRLVGPTDVPAGRFGVACDPLGAVFSLVEGTYDD